MEKIATIVAAIIGVATIAVLVQSSYTSSVISATGDAFSNSLKVAMGNVSK